MKKSMMQHTDQQQWYQSRFELFEKRLNGEASSDIHRRRREALKAFGEIGFPTTKQEEWRFTNVGVVAGESFQPVLDRTMEVSEEELAAFDFRTRHRIVFVNGHWSERLSSREPFPAGVTVGSLAEAIKANHPLVNRHLGRYVSHRENAFTALNTAFVRDGLFVHVPDGTVVEDPIHVIFLTKNADKALIVPRNLIVIGDRAKVSVVESYGSLSPGSYLTTVVTEIVQGAESAVEHDKLQIESELAYHVATTQSIHGERSVFTSNSVALGGAIVRNTIGATLSSTECECTLNGLALATGTQLIDNHTAIDHASPNCVSHELYKSILDGKSHGVFNGKIFVRQDAQKTDAKQTNKTLLLSDTATIDTKPQLEIFADDVKCTHGATVGQLDPDQVFYLRSRGIGQDDARDILTFAFAADVASRVHIEPLRVRIEALVREKLDRSRG